MNESEAKYPQWQLPLRRAILEVDPSKLAEKVQKAETAVRERLQALEQHENGHDERQALSDAISTLKVLKS